MAFLSFFRSEVPNILSSLKITRLELRKAQNDLERLLIMEQNYATEEQTECQYECYIRAAIDTFGVALWIKDEDHKFIFVNQACCHHILKCGEEEALNLTDTDFENDALAKECLKSDKKVMESRKTMRFIEHAVYSDGVGVFLDIVKSPIIKLNEVVGTIGSGVIITESIPKGIRGQHRKSNSIEIPVSSSLGTRKLGEVLERRKSHREKSDDNKYIKQRTKTE